MTRPIVLLSAGLLCGAVACVTGEDSGENRSRIVESGPYATSVASFAPGPGGGFGSDMLRDAVTGWPSGGETWRGSTDVVSLGVEGEIVVRLGQDLVDAEGADLLIFENPFFVSGSDRVFVEPGAVAVSADQVTWYEWPCDPVAPDYDFCAGIHPVVAATPEAGPNPRDPAVAGGDAFDLADLGETFAEPIRFVRIRDLGLSPRFAAGADGFDLDAVVIAEPRPVP